ncbi:polyketide synthase dehydratase domain-containing protein [Cohnella faecalis]|uniref:polyketide synthase dehydratase domain-containing protein n=1 Tax=Cohnella faecalis TaxID=2315694 RepID=UPI0013147647|nr:polyketide synthase dehydratase domain-containing protein [Cohnella faecalis]
MWKYRGQVTPRNDKIVVDLDILETGRDDHGVYAIAEASLWADGLQIYYVPRMGMRLVEDDGSGAKLSTLTNEAEPAIAESLFDPNQQPWIRDHCPTYTAPAMPSTFMLEFMAAAVQKQEPNLRIVGVADVQFKRWLICDRPRRLRTEVRRAAIRSMTTAPHGMRPFFLLGGMRQTPGCRGSRKWPPADSLWHSATRL